MTRFQECKTPFQDKTRTCHLLQMYRVHGLSPPPQRRKFDFLKWDENRLAEPLRFHSLTRLEPVLLLEGKEAAFLKPHASTTSSNAWVVKGTPSGSCRQPSMLYRDGSRMKQRRENVLTSHGHPSRETKDRTKSTGEVERLQDNRRGFKCGYLQQRL